MTEFTTELTRQQQVAMSLENYFNGNLNDFIIACRATSCLLYLKLLFWPNSSSLTAVHFFKMLSRAVSIEQTVKVNFLTDVEYENSNPF